MQKSIRKTIAGSLRGAFPALMCLAASACGMVSIFSPEAYLGGMVVQSIDLATADPGVYVGDYTLALPPGVFAKNRSFDVTVAIGVAHDVDVTVNEPSSLEGLGAEATRELNADIAAMVVRIETARAIPVDGVSGATCTSLALLKAVEAAVSP